MCSLMIGEHTMGYQSVLKNIGFSSNTDISVVAWGSLVRVPLRVPSRALYNSRIFWCTMSLLLASNSFETSVYSAHIVKIARCSARFQRVQGVSHRAGSAQKNRITVLLRNKKRAPRRALRAIWY